MSTSGSSSSSFPLVVSRRPSVASRRVRYFFGYSRVAIGVCTYLLPAVARYVFGISHTNGNGGADIDPVHVHVQAQVQAAAVEAHTPLLSLSKLFAIREVMLGLSMLDAHYVVRQAAFKANIICDTVDVFSYLTAVAASAYYGSASNALKQHGVHTHAADFPLHGHVLFGLGALTFAGLGIWLKANDGQEQEENQHEKDN